LSTNNGGSWDTVDNGFPVNTNVFAMAISGGNIFAGTSNGVFMSTNNGGSWAAVNTGLPVNIDINAMAISGGNIFAGIINPLGGGGVYLSTNNGGSWAAVDTGLPNCWVSALTISGDNIFAGTEGIGIYIRPLSDFGITGIEKITNNNNLAVYPNPANERITIELKGLNSIQNSLISICNIQGQTILQQSLRQSKTELDISGLLKGIYILKLNNGEKTEVQKLIKE